MTTAERIVPSHLLTGSTSSVFPAGRVAHPRLTRLDGVPDRVLRLLPSELMRRLRCVPMLVYRGALVVAAAKRLSRAAHEAIAAACGLPATTVRAEPGAVLRTIGRARRAARATVRADSARPPRRRGGVSKFARRERPVLLSPRPVLPMNLSRRLRAVAVETGGRLAVAADDAADARDVELATALVGGDAETVTVCSATMDALLAALPRHGGPATGRAPSFEAFADELGYGPGDEREAEAVWRSLGASGLATGPGPTSWEAVPLSTGWRAQDQARTVVMGRQKRAAVALGLALVGATVMDPLKTGAGMVLLVSLLYLATTIYRARLVLGGSGAAEAGPETGGWDDHDLPTYTVLIPLYREAVVVRNLLAAIDGFDYPHDKLDVKILLEADDTETIVAIQARPLPAYAEIIVVPPGVPTSKPRACNEGLRRARGAYSVIYDAEDIPEPDQLRKALRMFRDGGDRIGCVQSRLNYYNQRQNALTRWFTAEYSQWFDLYLPALSAGRGPVPLGGTSNHFPTALLQAVGGWDAFNVAEDADLGVRLHRAGFRTVVADSTTWEEATSRVPNWVRQRSRWIKGYAQTWLVHMRHPVRLYRELGPAGFLSFQMTVGGTVFMLLANPLFWVMTATWQVTRWGMIESLFPTPVFFAASITFLIGNAAFVYAAMLGAARRDYLDLVRWLPLLPIYWVLMSWAAWKGCLQLIYRPFYWEKTVHGHAEVGPGGLPLTAAGAHDGA